MNTTKNLLPKNITQTLLWFTLSLFVLNAHATHQLGDLAPRGAPDGQLTASDLVIMQQLVLNLITPTSEELIIADVAPLGAEDTLINGADMLVLQRAILGQIVLGTVGTPPRGTYSYTLQPTVGFGRSHVVEFHPDGSYAIILENMNVVHIYEWDTQTVTRFDLGPPAGNIFWEDVAFDPNGNSATLVGTQLNGADETGIVYHLDDTLLRQFLAGTGSDPVITKIDTATGSNPYVAIAYPWGSGGNPVILERTFTGAAYIASLREFNTGTGNFEGLFTAINSSAGCDDIAFANNEFGDPGILVVCGLNGSDVLFYTDVGGIGEWRINPGNPNIGNVSRTAAHINGDYALLVSWSSPRLFRFQNALLNSTADAPWFTPKNIYGIKFQNNGQRALIVGRASPPFPLSGTVIEYRHDEYSCPTFPSASCGLTDVSIPDFDMPPYNATSNTYLLDAAFRPGCDGGLIVGGETAFGLLIEFQIEGELLCH